MPIKRKGNPAKIAHVSSQPLKNAKMKPDTLIANERYICPIFSPSAL
jgi:hypothetical protein